MVQSRIYDDIFGFFVVVFSFNFFDKNATYLNILFASSSLMLLKFCLLPSFSQGLTLMAAS